MLFWIKMGIPGLQPPAPLGAGPPLHFFFLGESTKNLYFFVPSVQKIFFYLSIVPPSKGFMMPFSLISGFLASFYLIYNSLKDSLSNQVVFLMECKDVRNPSKLDSSQSPCYPLCIPPTSLRTDSLVH